MRACLIVVTLLLSVCPITADSRGFLGAPAGGSAAAPACTITGVSLDNSSFTAGAANNSLIGNVSVSTTNSCGTDTLTISGADFGVVSYNGSSSTTTIPATLNTVQTQSGGANNCASPPCTYRVNLIATISGATGSPFTQAETITANASGSSTVALTRTVNFPNGFTNGTLGYLTMGYPLRNTFSGAPVNDIPSGSIISSCVLGVTTVPCTFIARKLAANDSSVEWGTLMVDITGIPTVAPGGSSTLTLNVGTGSWPAATSTCTNAIWEALGDVLTLSNFTATAFPSAQAASGASSLSFQTNSLKWLTAGLTVTDLTNPAAIAGGTTISSVSNGGGTVGLSATTAAIIPVTDIIAFSNAGATTVADVTGTGTWTATFDGGATNTIETYGAGPQGLYVEVTAQLMSNGTAHRDIDVVMDYYVPEKADGTCPSNQPVMSYGPFIFNTLLHPSVAAKSTTGAFAFDAAFTRGVTTVRSEAGLMLAAMSVGPMTRFDGAPDWSADDPAAWVSQNYGLVVDTRKIPPFRKNITGYNPSAAGSEFGGPCTSDAVTGFTSTTLTINSIVCIYGNDPHVNQIEPAQFAGTVVPGGTSASTLYWLLNLGAKSIAVYDTFLHAYAGGATGRVTLTSAGTSAIVENVPAPGGTGQWDQSLTDSSDRPDLSPTTEWAAAYLVGNTQAWQNTGRIAALSQMSLGIQGQDAETGSANQRLLSVMDAANTPVGWTPYSTVSYGSGGNNSSLINSGVASPGGTNQWLWSGSATAHLTTGYYVAWLMEGAPVLRDMLLIQGEGLIAVQNGMATRNLVLANPTPTTYYGSTTCVYGGGATRVGAWHTMGPIFALFAATQGSQEETYFTNLLTENMNLCAALRTFEGTNFAALGETFLPDTLLPNVSSSSTILTPNAETFMNSYQAAVHAVGALLVQDRVAGLMTQATHSSQWTSHLYGFGGFQCGYFASAYAHSGHLSEINAASPGSYVSSWSEYSFNKGNAETASFNTSNPVIQSVNWSTGAGGPYTMAAGDHVRFSNAANDDLIGHVGSLPPSPFAVDTDYVVLAAGLDNTAHTYELATLAAPTTPLQATAAASGVYEYFVPLVSGNVTNCPATGSIQALVTNDDSYLSEQMSVLAAQVELGISAAGTATTGAYADAANRFLGACTQSAQWCWAPP